jgi:hypothetical protein
VVAGTTEDKLEVTARVGWSGTGVNLKTNLPSAGRGVALIERLAGTGRAITGEDMAVAAPASLRHASV